MADLPGLPFFALAVKTNFDALGNGLGNKQRTPKPSLESPLPVLTLKPRC